ncbi:UNVERIFIED_CONTAM: F-box protein [Sesamum latifolium]|uniref:F-box protein n=1 Tax=Sesamum latifolium TaxID=2727402 RepID=A0AAW2SLU3_9LAMI
MAQSLPELPPDILSEIFSRLPIKTLFACRSVCKAFLNLTFSNPPLNFLRSSDTAQSLIIQFGEMNKPTTLIHLVDSELDTSFESGEIVLLKPMFQIPKYPVKYFKKCRLYAGDENKFVLVNSCNGLLYFAERGVCERSFVCNPITDEYVTLVEFNEQNNQRQLTMGSWFGFSPAENQYKVLRLFSTLTGKPWQIGFRQEFWAQVHVVGSDSWRYLEDKPLSEYLSWDTCSVFLNGTVNWLCKYPELSKFIIFFDFQKEKFGEILPPPSFGIDQRLSEPLRGPLRPLQMLRDGKILLIWLERVLVCYDPKNKKFRFFEFLGVESLAKAVPYTPTFLRLKDALMVDNVTVQNITSSASGSD